MESEILQAKQIGKHYGATIALNAVTLSVNRGEIFGLVGPNGAGKTTFLKSIIGIVRLSSGSMTVCGIDVQKDALAVRRKTSYLPGEANLYVGMTGKSFLNFALSDYPNPDFALRDELVQAFELPVQRKIRGYSSGMKRKLLVIQALCAGTEFVLLDEPTEALDPTSRIILFSWIRKLADRGKTIVFSSHQLDEIENVCQRVAFLSSGKLLDCDTLEGIKKKASKRIRLTLREPVALEKLQLPGVQKVTQRGESYLIETGENPVEILRELTRFPIASLEYNRTRLSELYTDLYEVES